MELASFGLSSNHSSRNPHRQSTLRHIFGYYCARSGNGFRTYRNRGHQHSITANKSPGLNDSGQFIFAIVVAGNGASPNVDPGADGSVPQIAEMPRDCARGKAAVLDLHKIANVDSRLQVSPGAQMAEGANIHIVLHDRLLQHRCGNPATVAY